MLNFFSACGWYPRGSVISRGRGVAFELDQGDRVLLSHKIVHIFHLHTRTKPVCPAKLSLQCT